MTLYRPDGINSVLLCIQVVARISWVKIVTNCYINDSCTVDSLTGRTLMCEFESHSLQMSLFYYKGHSPFLYSYIAQMARAVDSYPTGRRFDSYCSYHFMGMLWFRQE